MAKTLTFVAATLLLLVAMSPLTAQTTPPEAPKKDGTGVQATPPASPPADAAKAKEPKAKADTNVETRTTKLRAQKAKPRKHVRARGRSHRVARHHRWRRVWVYRAHDRHGDRHYHLVWRKFGGYFARRSDCLCGWRGRGGHL
jgi:hypothetical protein